MEFTTIEKLQLAVSASYGAVIQYGDKVFVTDICWKGGFTAEIYEFIEFPEDTGGIPATRFHLSPPHYPARRWQL